MKKPLLFLFLLLISYGLSPAFSEKNHEEHSTDITSDRMTYAGQDNLIIFSGNVHVVRPDFELWSDELHVFLKESQPGQADPGQQDNIEKILAKGNVIVQSEGRTGTSNILHYFPDTEIARLEGNPRLKEGQNSVEGQTIILNMRDNTSEVLGGAEKRVRVIFHSEKE